MSKQNDIREGLKPYLCSCCDFFEEGKECGKECLEIDKALDNLLNYLHSQGAVKKVEGELPSIFNANEDSISVLDYKKKLAGYTLTKPI